jgi:protein-tyrosine phosphatase
VKVKETLCDSDKGPIKILFVCLGNICRSPTAEGVLRHLLATEGGAGPGVEVDSAGTGDYHLGAPPDKRSQRAAKARGIDLSGLSARQVRRRDFEDFDLILAMDRQNLRDLEAMKPSGSRAEVRLFLEYAGEPGVSEVPDPYTGNALGFEHVLDLVTDASRRLIGRLRNPGQPA